MNSKIEKILECLGYENIMKEINLGIGKLKCLLFIN